MRRLFLFVVCGLITSSANTYATAEMNAVAEKYAHLVLALGQHDLDYVDAFYGPAEWKTEAEKENKSLDQIAADAAKLTVDLKKMRQGTTAATEESKTSDAELLQLRREYLQKQISALAARVSILK